MNMQKGFPKPNLTEDMIIECIETCAICGDKLNFHHTTNYMDLKVQEETNCPGCGIKSQTNSFILQ